MHKLLIDSFLALYQSMVRDGFIIELEAQILFLTRELSAVSIFFFGL